MFVYLHGFASGPASFKARRFKERFAQRGVPLEVPALDGGDFEHLTLTGQLAIAGRVLSGSGPPAVLIGSSMGGYLAALMAARVPVDALVLMAPAADFAARWSEHLGADALEAWRREGSVEVDHVAQGQRRRLGWQLMEDAARYEAYPRFAAPALILHGRADDVVPLERVERLAAENPSAKLELFDSGHELVDVCEELIDRALAFLRGIPAVSRAHPTL
jgi:pimeloyl-ACP methyl ester carboxylesterase